MATYINPKKAALATFFERSGLNSLMLASQSLIYGRHARAVNYHDVSPNDAPAFEAQLAWFSKHFCNVGRKELDDLLMGRFTSNRPGLLMTFDDGLRSAAEVAAPLLEKYGFTGWFMVPAGFIDTRADKLAGSAQAHKVYCEDVYPDERAAMTWHQLQNLASRHIITCHGMTHRRLEASLTMSELEYEVCISKQLLENKLGFEVEGFTWVGGEEQSYSTEAARMIHRAGYRYAFMTNNAPIQPGTNPFQLQRTNIESWFPVHLVRFQLSGVLDAMYAPKRRRVNTITRV